MVQPKIETLESLRAARRRRPLDQVRFAHEHPERLRKSDYHKKIRGSGRHGRLPLQTHSHVDDRLASTEPPGGSRRSLRLFRLQSRLVLFAHSTFDHNEPESFRSDRCESLHLERMHRSFRNTSKRESRDWASRDRFDQSRDYHI